MDFSALKDALNGKGNQFETLINEGLQKDKDCLTHHFCSDTGEQVTPLNYLILEHDDGFLKISNEENDEGCNYLQHIHYLLKNGASLSVAQPINLALKLNKINLANLLLDKAVENKKDIDKSARDMEGRTLLSRAIDANKPEIINKVLDLGVDVNEPNNHVVGKGTMQMQPLHQAVVVNNCSAIKLLIDKGAQINNPCGETQQTALLMAASHGNHDALKTILQHNKFSPEDLTHKETSGKNAADLLTERLYHNQKSKDAMMGIAALVCHGAAVPTNEQWQNLLESKRDELFKEVQLYLAKQPHLVQPFVKLVHDHTNPWHAIFYTEHSLSRKFYNFFGKADSFAFDLEKLINSQEQNATEDEKKFSEFVGKYHQEFVDSKFANPWSSMLHKITKGEVTTWGEIQKYSQENPKSRTAAVVATMEDKHNQHTM